MEMMADGTIVISRPDVQEASETNEETIENIDSLKPKQYGTSKTNRYTEQFR